MYNFEVQCTSWHLLNPIRFVLKVLGTFADTFELEMSPRKCPAPAIFKIPAAYPHSNEFSGRSCYNQINGYQA
jgi:hypothetical protein